MYKTFRGWERDIGIRASLTELIKLAKATGFEGVEIDIQEAAELARERGLEYIKNLFADAHILPAGWPLTMVNWHAEEKTYQEGLSQLPSFAEFGQWLGCTRVLSVVLPYSDELPFKENFEFHVTRLQSIAEILKDYDCRLGLEYIGSKIAHAGHKYEFIRNMEGLLDLCDSIGTGNVGLLLDSWHWYTAQETLNDLRQLNTKDIVYIHVNDAPNDVPFDQLGEGPRCIPGETGVINLVGFLKCLREIKYDGPVAPEPNHRFCDKVRRMSALEAARALSEALNKLWREAGLC